MIFNDFVSKESNLPKYSSDFVTISNFVSSYIIILTHTNEFLSTDNNLKLK